MTARRRAVLTIAATTAAVAAFMFAASPQHATLTAAPSPFVAGSALSATPGGLSAAAAVEAVTPSTAPVAPPPGVVRGVSPRPGSNDGMIILTQRVCGTSKSWVSQAKANGIAGPDYVVLDSARLTIDCNLAPIPAPVVAANPAPSSSKLAATSAPWTAALPGKCLHPNGSREFGVQRPGHMHAGIDLGASTGTPIHAIHGGIAHWGYQASGAGIYVWIDHGDNTSSWYFHESRRAVPDGARVVAGQVIGFVGMTGNATAPHLHLGVKQGGTWVDPVRFLRARGVEIGC